MHELAKKLSLVDEPEKWKEHTSGYSEHDIRIAYKVAVPLWVERMILAEKLLFHPDVTKDIQAQGFELNDLQSRMAWASILATDTSSQSRERFKLLKKKIIGRHGRDWWEDVYQRRSAIYAASMKIKESWDKPAMATFFSCTILGAQCADDEKIRALRKLPKN